MFHLIPMVSSRVINKVLQNTKMVLFLEICAFVVKQYNEIHLLEYVCDDLILEFLNSASPSNHATLNLIKKV